MKVSLHTRTYTHTNMHAHVWINAKVYNISIYIKSLYMLLYVCINSNSILGDSIILNCLFQWFHVTLSFLVLLNICLIYCLSKQQHCSICVWFPHLWIEDNNNAYFIRLSLGINEIVCVNCLKHSNYNTLWKIVLLLD